MYPFVDPIKPSLRLLYKPLDNCLTAGCHMDVFLPKAAEAPVVILIHGGAFVQGSSTDIPFNQVAWFTERGAVCVSVEYRLAPHAHFKEIREDLRDAYRYVQEELQASIDVKLNGRCAIAGSSAGGTSTILMVLEAMQLGLPPVALMPAYPLIFNEGPTEFGEPRSAMEEMFGDKPEWATIQCLFNEPVCVSDPYPEDVFNPDMTKPRIAFVQAGFASRTLNSFIMGRDPPFGDEGNFLTYLKSDFPPTLVICAMQDKLIPVRHSLALIERLESLGVQVKGVKVEADHGFVDLPATVFKDSSEYWKSIEPSLEWVANKLHLMGEQSQTHTP